MGRTNLDEYYFKYISEKRSKNVKEYIEKLKTPESTMLPPGMTNSVGVGNKQTILSRSNKGNQFPNQTQNNIPNNQINQINPMLKGINNVNSLYNANNVMAGKQMLNKVNNQVNNPVNNLVNQFNLQKKLLNPNFLQNNINNTNSNNIPNNSNNLNNIALQNQFLMQMKMMSNNNSMQGNISSNNFNANINANPMNKSNLTLLNLLNYRL